MSYIDWTDVLDIGLPSIDDQHKELFSISNDLLEAIGRGEGKTALVEAFDRLKKYTEYHFKEEEDYMRSVGYPGAEQHAKEHSELLISVNKLRKRLASGETVLPEEGADFISDWIINHIMHSDSKIGIHAKSKF